MAEDTSLDCFKRDPIPRPENLKNLKEEKSKLDELKNNACKTKWVFKFSFCPCPVCLASISVAKTKPGGKAFFKIPFTNFKIPRIDNIFPFTINFDQNRRPGEQCGACGGTKKIPNVQNDTPKYEQVKAVLEKKSETLKAAENKLGSGGNDTTIVVGNKTDIIGIGHNANRTFKIIEGGGVAGSSQGRITGPGAVKCNEVVGIQSGIAWPQGVGTYTIKCANALRLLSGAGGIDLSTNGNVNITGGITRITGPQITIGCSQGPLVLEGDSVQIGGKFIHIAPTTGATEIKGTLKATGNMSCGGHLHAEGLSFTKGAAVGKRDSTEIQIANPDTSLAQNAIWANGKGLIACVLEISKYYQATYAEEWVGPTKLTSPADVQNLMDKFMTLAKMSTFFEYLPTGFVFPGTFLGIGNLGAPVVAASFIPVFNLVHNHGIPEMPHKHYMRVPDIDLSSENQFQLQLKVNNFAQDGNFPNNVATADSIAQLYERLQQALSTVFETGRSVLDKVSRNIRTVA